MEHVAIDLGGRESQICIRKEDGTIVAEERVATAKLAQTLVVTLDARPAGANRRNQT